MKNTFKKHKNFILFYLLIAIFLSFSVVSQNSLEFDINNENSAENLWLNDQEIIINTPENKTYTKPMSGYYPATFGFENDQIGVVPEGLTDDSPYSSCSISVYDQVDGHNKVVQIYDANTGTGADAIGQHTFASPKVMGTVECWVYKESGDCALVIQGNNDTTSGFQITIDADDNGIFRYSPAPSTYIEFASGKYSDQTWFHLRIDFNCDTDTTDIYVNGIKEVDDGLFVLPVPNISFIQIRSGRSGRSGILYFDAVGLSWHSSYNIGENLNEGLLLSYQNSTNLDWKGYSLDGAVNKTILGNTTIPMPSLGHHTIQVYGNNSIGEMFESDIRHFSINAIDIITPENKTYTNPMSGYYPATYGFENDAIGSNPRDWSVYEVGGTVNVIDSLGNHNKIVEVHSTSSDHARLTNTFAATATGTIECWVRTNTIIEDSIVLRASDGASTDEFVMSVNSATNKWKYSDAGTWTDMTADVSANTWYHIKIEFDCADDWHVWIDGVSQDGGIGFRYRDSPSQMDRFNIGTTNQPTDCYAYFDAIGYSWDPGYTIGDNLEEGLLLSYENRTNLDWIAYSLDNQPNKTILGNKTIPMLNNGLHSIQLFGNGSLGEIYESEVRFFTMDISIQILINTPQIGAYYGFNAPSFDLSITVVQLNTTWYTLDNGITNITFTNLTGSIEQLEWENYGHGIVTIRFYANNTFGQQNYADILINKDLNPPTSTLSFVPYSGINVVTESTVFTISANDISGSGVSIRRYKINNSGWLTYTGPFTLSGFSVGDYLITYQAIDTVGNIESEQSFVVELYQIPEPPPGLPMELITIIIIIASIAIISSLGMFLVYKKRKARIFVDKKKPKPQVSQPTQSVKKQKPKKIKRSKTKRVPILSCPFCEAELPGNQKFCFYCGANLEE